MVARTRFQQAIPTTFGLKVAGWLAPLLRHRQRLAELLPRLLVVQLGGAAGNLAALGDRGVEVMEDLARELGLACPPMPWHSQRDGLIELAGWLSLVTGSLGKLGQDVLLLAQNEVGEIREADGGGSSTMPQKSNPIRAEALVTLARSNATLVAGMHQAALHAHERDGAAWQLEWKILPDMVLAAGSALGHATALARRWSSTPQRCDARSTQPTGCRWPRPPASRWLSTSRVPRRGRWWKPRQRGAGIGSRSAGPAVDANDRTHRLGAAPSGGGAACLCPAA